MKIINESDKTKLYLGLGFAIFLILIILGEKAFWPLVIIALVVLTIKKNFPTLFKNQALNFNIFKAKTNNIMDTINVSQREATKKIKKLFIWIIGVIIVIWLFASSVVVVEAGQTGVYSLFGKVRDRELASGFYLINPLAKVTQMSIRTEEYTMSIMQGEGKKQGADSIKALTSEGLEVDLDITVLYHLEESQASGVYKDVGLQYEDRIIRPSIRSTIREVIANYNSKDIYSSKREEAVANIFSNLQEPLGNRGIILEEVLLRNVQLPANLAQSIQEKLQAEQEAQKYEYLLQTEKKEKERKIIEAEGQRDAQTIINSSLTPNYLYYLYVSNLEEREGTIYVPTNPETGLPMFRNLGQ
ncbi:MAG: prohibitin family protein [Candidatus Pacebacteria bacterium]|nr:prohibitin family protein [Candidatus Paceibacterota bacterium]